MLVFANNSNRNTILCLPMNSNSITEHCTIANNSNSNTRHYKFAIFTINYALCPTCALAMCELESAENCLVWKSLYCDLCKDDLCEDDFFVVLCLRWRIRWYATAGIVNSRVGGQVYQ